MSDEVTVSVVLKYDADELWSRIFGADPESFGSWWLDMEYLSGDWDKAGEIRVSLEDPDEGEGSGIPVVKVLTIQDLADALSKCPPHVVSDVLNDNVDCIVAGYVIQVAVFGDCVYG